MISFVPAKNMAVPTSAGLTLSADSIQDAVAVFGVLSLAQSDLAQVAANCWLRSLTAVAISRAHQAPTALRIAPARISLAEDWQVQPGNTGPLRWVAFQFGLKDLTPSTSALYVYLRCRNYTSKPLLLHDEGRQ